jgi:hypothetical protein
MMVAGTAAAVGLALVNDRRLTPVFVEASPTPARPLVRSTPATLAGPLADPRGFIARRLGVASLLAVAGIVLAAAIPAIAAIALGSSQSSSAAVSYGPPIEQRAAAGIAGNWERSYGAAVPPASDLGAAVLAGEVQRQQLALEEGLRALAAQRAAASVRAAAPSVPTSLNRASGYAVGTIVSARITIYGCTGPGGGFCGNMSSGVRVFEGAAACSADLPFGTKLRIIGDPTGRIYECLDRGALKSTWVDVFFNNTSEGIRWQSLLGGTIAQIEIVN